MPLKPKEIFIGFLDIDEDHEFNKFDVLTDKLNTSMKVLNKIGKTVSNNKFGHNSAT